MKLCGFDVQPGHGGAERSAREGIVQHLPGGVEL